jgi:hypothetical protein
MMRGARVRADARGGDGGVCEFVTLELQGCLKPSN